MDWSRIAAAAKAFVEEVKEAIGDSAGDVTAGATAAAGDVSDATQEAVATIASETRRGVAEIETEVRQGLTRIVATVTKAAEAVTLGGPGAGGAMAGLAPPDRDEFQERLLTEDEKNLAREVFQATIPYGAVWLSNVVGLDERPYTVPHPRRAGSYVIHFGRDGFADATDSSVTVLGMPADAAFVHEMTHVWQGRNRWNPFDYVIDSVFNQIVHCQAVYEYELTDDAAWSDFSAEQQAHIVGDWYRLGKSETDDRFRFIRDNIRTGTP